jgi:hypothetical protein
VELCAAPCYQYSAPNGARTDIKKEARDRAGFTICIVILSRSIRILFRDVISKELIINLVMRVIG